MLVHEVGELKEALGVHEANDAIEQGWQLVTVVPRGALLVYVMGKKKLHGMAAAVAKARTLQPVDE